MMRRLVKIVFLFVILSWAAVGLRHAHGRRGDAATHGGTLVATASSQPATDVAVDVDERFFVLKNLTLTAASASTILKGNVVNTTKRELEEVAFEVRAYDRDGRVLRGAENRTIFYVRHLEPNAYAPINHGHGVWLQGIPIESIVRLEVFEAKHESASRPSWTDWFAGHAVTRIKDSEIEE